MDDVLEQLNSVDPGSLSSMVGLMQPSGFDIFALIASVVFGIIGFFAFMNGKKSSSWKRMVLGIALMVYPYFVPGAIWVCAVGVGLCAALYFWRD